MIETVADYVHIGPGKYWSRNVSTPKTVVSKVPIGVDGALGVAVN